MAVKGTYLDLAGTPSALRASVLGSFGGKAAEMATLLALATLVPRALGPHAYGRFALPLTVVTLGSLALTLGGPAVLARFVPAAPAQQRPAVARALGWRLAKGRMAQLAGAGVLVVVVAASGRTTISGRDALLVSAALALNVAATLILQVGLGLGRTVPWTLRYPLQNAVLIAGVLALHRPAGPVGGLWALVLAGGVGVAYAAVSLRAELRSVLAAPSAELPSGALRFGVLSAGGAALTQVAQRGGVVAVALLGPGAVAVGHTSLALGIALGATYAVLQAFTVSLPHLAGSRHAAAAEPALRRLAELLLAPLALGCTLAAVTIDRVVPLVFGDRFVDAADAFGPALVLVVLAPVSSLLVQAAALRLRPEAVLSMGLANLAGFAAAAVLAVPSAGAVGGTGAAAAGAALGVAVGLRLLPGAAGGRLVAATVVAAVVLAGASW
ncbi:MAG: hypothetical protein ACLGI8_06455 [Acidimicrobiia bacterium]